MIGPGRLGAIAIAAALASGPAADRGLTRGDLVGRAYDTILDARPGQIEPVLADTCGPAPPEACRVLRAANLWWQILQDWDDTRHDGRLLQAANDAIAAADAWTRRAPQRAESWFYLGAAYAVRLQWRGLRGDRLTAARDGKRVKDALERAIAIDPHLEDAYFGIGMYHYYADIMPSVLKILRWLLLMPGGDREQGLAEMLRTRTRGEVLRGEADFQLHQIYLWYENRPDRALELLAGLRERYPHNPIFVRLVAETHDIYRHDPAASLAAYRELISLADRAEVGFAPIAGVQGRIGAAQQWLALEEADRAIDLARQVVAAGPAAPVAAVARASLVAGRAADSIGRRDDAVAAYHLAIANAPAGDPTDLRAAARAGLGRPPDRQRAQARRLSLEGWRAIEGGEIDAAQPMLERAVSLNAADPVARYRLGRLLALRGETLKALDEFERVRAIRPVPPGATLGAACYEAGRLNDAIGNRARALDLYREAVRTLGATADTRARAAEALARKQ